MFGTLKKLGQAVAEAEKAAKEPKDSNVALANAFEVSDETIANLEAFRSRMKDITAHATEISRLCKVRSVG